MSRVEADTEKWHVVFGVSDVSKNFVQIWEQPHEEQDTALLVIDSLVGVRVTQPKGRVVEIPERARYIVERLQEQYSQSNRLSGGYPLLGSEPMFHILRGFGFGTDVLRQVYEVLNK